MGVRFVRTAAALTTLAALGCPLATDASVAGSGGGPTAAVAMGDSFISGEGGRWLGNSSDPTGDRGGTDRAAQGCGWWGCRYDPALVYGASEESGCHRSDTAPIESAAIAVARHVNLACSGARVGNVWRAASGGTAHRGEPPQADQLARVAHEFDVRLIVLTVGANDLGFGRLVLGCALAWLTTPASDPRLCHPGAQERLEAGMPAARSGLLLALDEIRTVMRAAGYGRSDYRLIVAGYASPLPRGADFRHPEASWARLHAGGCPIWNADADWAARVAVPWISATLAWAAAVRGAKFLDLSRALEGHELCHRGSARASAEMPPSATGSEWVRAIAPGQGALRESLHPNAYGQRAIGRCLALAYRAAPGDWSCRRRGPGIRSAYLEPAR